MGRFGLCGIMTAHPGQRDALRDLLLEAANVVANLPGCELWIVNTMPDNPDAIWVTEVWRSEADHAASLAGDDVRAIIARARPLIAGFGERFTLEPVGGKGLAASSLARGTL
jgi:quinol monooxygenase YgiN